MFSNKIQDGICSISVDNKPCQYGSRSFPSVKAVQAHAASNPAVKFYQFETPDNVGKLSASAARGTIGAYITRANKSINGIDFHMTESRGSGSGSVKRGKIDLKLSADGQTLIIIDGDSSANIHKGSDGFHYRGLTLNRKICEVAIKIQAEARESSIATIESMVTVKYQARLKIADNKYFTVDVESDDYAKAAGALVAALITSGKIQHVDLVKTPAFSVVTMGLDDYANWAGLRLA
jgi:hypothetical protein